MLPKTRRKQTDYSNLANRCQECGHRLSQHNTTRCLIVTNPTRQRDAEGDVSCGCKAV